MTNSSTTTTFQPGDHVVVPHLPDAVGIVLAVGLGGANAHHRGNLAAVTYSDGRPGVLAMTAELVRSERPQTRRSGEAREHAVPCRGGLSCGPTWNHGARCDRHVLQHELAGLAVTPANEAEARAWGSTFGESF